MTQFNNQQSLMIEASSIIIRGHVVLYSFEDTDLIEKYNWFVHNPRNQYHCVKRNRSKKGQDIYDVKLHRLIAQKMGLDIFDKEVDHINRNPLDNRRENLRIATRSQNCINRANQTNNKSGYKGVSWFSQTNRWRARIKVQNRQIHLGFYLDPVEAAKAYDKAALEYFGEFAWLNISTEGK